MEKRGNVVGSGLVLVIGLILTYLIWADFGKSSSFIGLVSIMLPILGLSTFIGYLFKFSIRMFLFN